VEGAQSEIGFSVWGFGGLGLVDGAQVVKKQVLMYTLTPCTLRVEKKMKKHRS